MATIFDKLTEENKIELAAATSRKMLTTEDLQEYKKKDRSNDIVAVVLFAGISLIYYVTKGHLLLGLIVVAFIILTTCILRIIDTTKVSKNKILYKVKAYVLYQNYGLFASYIFMYYDFYKNDFTYVNKTISTFPKSNIQLHEGNYIDIIAEQTSKKVKFIDYL